MPFALIIVGLIIIAVGFQNTYKELAVQLSNDFSGEGNFTWWLVSIFVIGAIGYGGGKGSKLQLFSRVFMALIIIAIILSNNKSGNNFFTAFTNEIEKGTGIKANFFGAPITGTGGGSGGKDDGGGLGDLVGTAATVASFF